MRRVRPRSDLGLLFFAQRTAERQGFQVAYTRAKLVRAFA